MSDDGLLERWLRRYDRATFFNSGERLLLIGLLLVALSPAFLLSNLVAAAHGPEWLQGAPYVACVPVLIWGLIRIVIIRNARVRIEVQREFSEARIEPPFSRRS